MKHIPINAIERKLLHALSQGTSNRDIALNLCKSEFTVRNQLSSLFKKIRVENRTQAAFWYMEHHANIETMSRHTETNKLPANSQACEELSDATDYE